MSDLYYDYGYMKEKVRVNSSFASCCGSRFRPGEVGAKPERKWKNQHGEGVLPATPAQKLKVDMEHGNTSGILLATGKHEEVNTDSIVSKQIKTKNGWITVSSRIKW